MLQFRHGTSEHDCRYGERVRHFLVTIVKVVIIKSRQTYHMRIQFRFISDGFIEVNFTGNIVNIHYFGKAPRILHFLLVFMVILTVVVKKWISPD